MKINEVNMDEIMDLKPLGKEIVYDDDFLCDAARKAEDMEDTGRITLELSAKDVKYIDRAMRFYSLQG